jgi:N-acetylglucosaminyl-diphospho-decaprenol L-rhamnosyltransferase
LGPGVDLSLVLVTFGSSGVAGDAIATFRAEAARFGAQCEVILVDHSEDAAELGHLEQLAPDRLLVEPNRGYAAGVNAGVAASAGATVLVGNPDIRFKAGSLPALLDALASGWDVVGPRFELGAFLLPPADVQTPREEARRWLASRSRPFWSRYFAGEVRRWRRVWEATEPVAVPNLSGALLAFRREAARKVGPWDEGYFLFFEETDWLRRAAGAGLRVAQVPGAGVEHRWGHAADPTSTRSHLLRSRRRYLRSHFGLAGRIVTPLTLTRTPLRPQALVGERTPLPSGELRWLLSPTSLGFPAGGFVGTAPACVQAVKDFFGTLPRPSRHLLLAVEPTSGELEGAWSWEPAHG